MTPLGSVRALAPLGRLSRPRGAVPLVRAGIVGALLVVTIGGCGPTGLGQWARNGFKLGPNYSQPPAPLAAEWLDANHPAVQNRQVDEWWHVFQDPILDRLIETAYRQDLNLRAVGLRVMQARAQRAIAVGNVFPQTQQLDGRYDRVALSHNTFNNPAAIGEALPPGTAVAPPLIGNYYPEWSTSFNLSWELDLWGRFRRAIESAEANVEASVGNYDAALVTLLADVATDYVQYRVAQQRIKIAQDNVRIQEGVLALAQERFDVGTATRLDVEQARTILEQTRSAIPALQIALGVANDQLCTLMGEPPRDLGPEFGEGTALGADPMASVPTWVAVGIPADLLRRRPDVRAAERQVAAQSAQIGVTEADLYPAFSVNGTVGFEAADVDKWFNSRSWFGSFGPSFRWNVLNYGRIKNNVLLQDARTQELVAVYQNQVLVAAQEVQTALRGFLRSREQADALNRSVQAAVAATELGIGQYRGGTVNFTPVFQFQGAQVSVQDQLAVVRGNVALNLINVYRALGGGWEIRTRPEDRGPPPTASTRPAERRSTRGGSNHQQHRAAASPNDRG